VDNNTEWLGFMNTYLRCILNWDSVQLAFLSFFMLISTILLYLSYIFNHERQTHRKVTA